ncbi:MAG: ABC transporter permease [Planctomycetes bacterium]|nr:ABC transporter permease [Planctomycetota bacterium]
MNAAGLIIANAVRNKRRTILTILSLGASVFLFATLESLLQYMTSHALDNGSARRIVVRRKTSLQDRLPQSYIQKVASVDGIECVTPMVWFGGIYKEETAKNMFGQLSCDPETWHSVIPEAEILDPATGKPAPQLYDDFRKDRQGALAGIHLFEKFGWKIGDQIVLQGKIYPCNLTLNLRAAYNAPRGGTDESTLYYHHKYIDESLGNPGLIGVVEARVKNSDDIPRLIDQIDGGFADSDFQTFTETEQAFSLGFVKMLGNLTMLVHSIATAVAFTMLMVAANTTASAARERAHEVAVMKAIGFAPTTVLRYLLFENVLVAFSGAGLGAAAAYFFSAQVRAAMQQSPMAFFFEQYQMAPAIAIGSTLVGAIVGLCAALIPCARVAWMPISTTLRRVA